MARSVHQSGCRRHCAGPFSRPRKSGELQEDSAMADAGQIIGHWIGGKTAEGRSGRFADVWNPAEGEVQAKVALASAGEVDQAVAAAAKAFPEWAATPPLKRARVMFKFKELIERHIGELA